MGVFRFFFFQAEDGIRDDLVTGVQTCALPILAEGRTLFELQDSQSVKSAISNTARLGKELAEILEAQ